jgi:hypothetical protein
MIIRLLSLTGNYRENGEKMTTLCEFNSEFTPITDMANLIEKNKIKSSSGNHQRFQLEKWNGKKWISFSEVH